MGFVVAVITAVAGITRQLLAVRVIKFLLSGFFGSLACFLLLFVLTEVGHLWYLASYIIAFLIGQIVGFLLQKYWTFSHRDSARVVRESKLFLLKGVFFLGLSSLLLWVTVQYIHLNYLVSLVLINAPLAWLDYRLVNVLFGTR